MTLDDLLRQLLDHHAKYHHHKEQMAYTAATLYLATLSLVAIRGPALWEPRPTHAFLAWFVVSLSAVGFFFVGWQLRMRDRAYLVVRACVSLLTRSLHAPSESRDLTPKAWGTNEFPAVLVTTITGIAGSRSAFDGPRTSEAVTYLVMAAWAIGSLLVLCTSAA